MTDPRGDVIPLTLGGELTLAQTTTGDIHASLNNGNVHVGVGLTMADIVAVRRACNALIVGTVKPDPLLRRFNRPLNEEERARVEALSVDALGELVKMVPAGTIRAREVNAIYTAALDRLYLPVTVVAS